MAAEEIVLLTDLEFSRQHSVFRSSCRPVVKTGLLGKGPSPPSLHPGARDRRPVNASTRNWLVSTNIAKALRSEQLACTGYVLDVHEPIVILNSVFDKRRASDAKVRHGLEFL